MNRRNLIKIATAAAISAGAFGLGATAASAQEVTLRMHQFLPAQANVPAHILIPSAEKTGKAVPSHHRTLPTIPPVYVC